MTEKEDESPTASKCPMSKRPFFVVVVVSIIKKVLLIFFYFVTEVKADQDPETVRPINQGILDEKRKVHRGSFHWSIILSIKCYYLTKFQHIFRSRSHSWIRTTTDYSINSIEVYLFYSKFVNDLLKIWFFCCCCWWWFTFKSISPFFECK